VHEDDQPFTGWVKTTGDTGKVKQLGFLKKGRKEGVWMDWYSGGNKKSQIVWAEDRMEGSFTVWHPNGKIKVVGQTRDGEVDGEWKEYYSNGTLACQSTNRTGHLVDLMVWKPDGSRCQQSKVSQGKGSFVRYFEDGSIEHIRTFAQGVETSREIFHQR
jgi:antitoxin component YwqK of YwqJK toxin-antitoxin module